MNKNFLSMGKRVIKHVGLRVKYFGYSHYCPVCCRYARKFVAFGQPGRPNAICPFCGSRERHRLFWLYFERKTRLITSPPENVLHIAPEQLIEKRFRTIFGNRYITADLNEKDVDVKMDITNILYENASFDFIYCSHVLEHVLDDQRAMREFARVLKPGGLAVLNVPITTNQTYEDSSIVSPQARLDHFGQVDHVRRYGPDYMDRLIKAGFSVIRIAAEDFLSEHERKKMAITSYAGEVFECTV